jgi:hypothetical protein
VGRKKPGRENKEGAGRRPTMPQQKKQKKAVSRPKERVTIGKRESAWERPKTQGLALGTGTGLTQHTL